MKRYIRAAVNDLSNESPETLKELARTTTRPDVLLRLASSEFIWDVALEALENPNTPFIEIAKRGERRACRHIAWTTKDPKVLTVLADNEDLEVRESVAKNPKTPNRVLVKLARLGNTRINDALLRRKKLSDSVMIAMLDSANTEDVKWNDDGIATQLLRKIADDHKEYNTPYPSDKVAIALAKYPNWYSQSELLVWDINEEWKLPTEAYYILADPKNDKWVRAGLSEAKDVPFDIIEGLLNDPSSFVRRNVAIHTKLPEQYYYQLAQDEAEDVREFLAKNPNVPNEVLQILAQDDVDEVREAAAEVLYERGIEL